VVSLKLIAPTESSAVSCTKTVEPGVNAEIVQEVAVDVEAVAQVPEETGTKGPPEAISME